MVNFALEDIKNSVQRPSNDELGCLSLNIDSEYIHADQIFQGKLWLVVTIAQLERQ